MSPKKVKSMSGNPAQANAPGFNKYERIILFAGTVIDWTILTEIPRPMAVDIFLDNFDKSLYLFIPK